MRRNRLTKTQIVARDRNLSALRKSYELREDRWLAEHRSEILANPTKYNSAIVAKAKACAA